MKLKLRSPVILNDLAKFGSFLRWYARSRGYRLLTKFEVVKDVLVDALYKKRGRYARPILHLGTIGLVFLVITLGPLIFNQSEEGEQSEDLRGILATQAYGTSFYTQQAEEVRQYRGGEIITHLVAEGETLSDIAIRYGLSVETILWENNLTAKAVLKPGQEVRILPVDGVRHKVKRGETVYSIGKRYGLEESQVQAIVDYPFNEFSNDETFELATGQHLMVPGGVMPSAVAPAKPKLAQFTPDAGSVTAVGSFVWPASGRITQGYSFYHKAIDIANKSGGSILAADGGTVVSAGWPNSSGYGNLVMIDHGNGYVTLYAHLSLVQVREGQRVNRGDVIGQMGSTGRSTGVHLHFEVRRAESFLNPLGFLQ
ncbi:MAG: M23 family metallopeptidase [Patescibacteria group bacterium]|nr:M23 family metallopeptidase [Patescibacteria group bacterium]